MNKYYIEPTLRDNVAIFEESPFNALVALNVDNPLRDKVDVYSICDGGHCTATVDYLQTCKEISKEEYSNLTKGFYVPLEYVS